jgi:energy-coupling factor transporter transmembrane protein EcfT
MPASRPAGIATLMLTTPFPRLLQALHFYRLPAMLIGVTGMAYRYAFLLADACYRMIAAAQVRRRPDRLYSKIETRR